MNNNLITTMSKAFLANSGREGTLLLSAGAVSIPAGFYISGIQVTSAMVVTSQTAYTDISVANLAGLTSIPPCFIPTKLSALTITSGEGIAFLSRI